MRTAFEGAIKRPVKEAVREALAEGVHGSEESRPGDEPVTVDVESTDDGGSSAEDGSNGDAESGSGGASRFLRPRRVAVLAGIVLVTYLRRRRRSDDDAE